MDEVLVQVEAEVNPTESEDKVRKAIANVMPHLPLEKKPARKGFVLAGMVKGKQALQPFADLLRRERIRSAARVTLMEGIRGSVVSFSLNKQVAFVGHVSFVHEEGESPLGPIRVSIKCDEPKMLVDWLTFMNV